MIQRRPRFGGAFVLQAARNTAASFRRRPESSEIRAAQQTEALLSASHGISNWIPACAGMTLWQDRAFATIP
jgi:hypothetical protein